MCIYYKGYSILETKSKQFIHRSHHVWFDEYNSCLSIERNHNLGSLLLQKYPESHIHNSDLLILIPCKLDLTYTPFSDTTILAYEID